MAYLKLKGKVLTVDTLSGLNKKGKEWTRHDVLIQPYGPNQSKLMLTGFSNDYKQIPKLVSEDIVEVECEVESREYQGKYYTQVNIKEIYFSNETKEDRGEEIKEPANPNDVMPYEGVPRSDDHGQIPF